MPHIYIYVNMYEEHFGDFAYRKRNNIKPFHTEKADTCKKLE
jgi:hypothetical protein